MDLVLVLMLSLSRGFLSIPLWSHSLDQTGKESLLQKDQSETQTEMKSWKQEERERSHLAASLLSQT